MKNIKLIYIIVVFLILLTSITFIVVEAQTGVSRDNVMSIKTPYSAWVVNTYRGDEAKNYYIKFSNHRDQRAEICIFVKNNLDVAPNRLSVYDRRGRAYQIPKITRNGRQAYCARIGADVPLVDYIRVGRGTAVVEYQETNTINYHSAWFDVNSTLYINLSDSWNNTVNNIWIENLEDANKFGANVTGFTKNQQFKYTIESSNIIHEKNLRKYFINRTTQFECGLFDCLNEEKHFFDFTDVCTSRYNETIINEDGEVNDTLLFDTDCRTTLSNDNKTLEVIFFGEYNSSLGMIRIDPTVTITDVSSTVSDKTFITAENKYTHITIDTTSKLYGTNDAELYYPFDVNVSQTTIYDHIVNDNDGTLQNQAHITDSGYIGSGLRLDGDGDEVFIDFSETIDSLLNCPTGVPTPPCNPFSITVWVNVTEGLNNNVIFSQRNNVGTGRTWLTVTAIGTVKTFIGAGSKVIVNETNFTFSKWQHIGLVYNGSEFRGYLDGVKQEVAEELDDTDEGSSGDYRLGAAKFGGQEFNGTMDELTFFSRELTDANIVAINNSRLNKKYRKNGNQTFNDINVSGDATENFINLTINKTEFFGSMINISIGEVSGDSYVYGDQLSFTGNTLDNVRIEDPNNISLRFIFYPGGDVNPTSSWITPSLENDIQVDSFVGDSCGYFPQQDDDFEIQCYDNCTISEDVAINNGFNLVINGTGGSAFFSDGTTVSNIKQLLIPNYCYTRIPAVNALEFLF